MRKMKICNLLVVLLILACNTAVAQQFFNGTVNTTSAINRTGSVGIGNVLFRSASGIQVLEHTYPTGDFYIRSVAYQVQNDVGNLILNDIGGFVGIGTSKPKEMLSVNGKIRAQEIKVETANWPDYVFTDDYQLPTLKETAEFIDKNKHLPGVPKATEVEENGLSLGEMNRILLQKIEEMTLHLIKQQQQIKDMQDKINSITNK